MVVRPPLPDHLEGPDGLLLRRWRPEDAGQLVAAVTESVDHLRPWMDWIDLEPITVGRRRAWVQAQEREWAGGGDMMLGIFVGEAVAGGCGAHHRIAAGGVEIGYWIHPLFTRRGLATESARLLTAALLAHDGITHVEIHHDKANVASRAVPAKLGYEFVGETPDEIAAPAEVGINCIWRMSRDRWATLQRR
jgi:RimJ/RimL family protein N-acetyltransferase